AADCSRGSVSSDGGRHVLLHSWRWSVPEARPGRAHHHDRFHPRAYGYHQRGGFRGPRAVLSDVGAGTAQGLWCGSARASHEAAPASLRWSKGRHAMNAASENKGSDQGRQRHIPVLLEPVLASLRPRAGQVIVDGTFGAGGYTTAILEQGA